VKPVFGRASTNVYHIKPDKPVPQDIDVSEDCHYIAQEWITGDRYCSYTIVRDGKIKAHGVYPVLDTIDGSSSVYFRQKDHPRIKEYIKNFVSNLPTLTGQLAFDFVEKGERLIVLECNPRATSGLHLWSDTPLLARAITDSLRPEDVNEDGFSEPARTRTGRQPRRQVAPGMLMWEHDNSSWKQWWKHMRHLMGARDVMWTLYDLTPSLMQPFLLTSYYKICHERQLELPEMFQWDVSWVPEGEHLQNVRKFVEAENLKDKERRTSDES